MEASSTGSINVLIYVCSPTVVETSEVFKKGVLTRFKRFGVLTRPIRLGVLTRFRRLGVLTRPIRFAVDTRLSKLGVLTWPLRFGVLTRPMRFGVLTNPSRLAEEIYPACPKFPTVEAKALWRAEVDTRFSKLGVLT